MFLVFSVVLVSMGMVAAEDFVKVTDIPIKDLGNLSLEEINAIFSGDGDGGWFMNYGAVSHTPSQMAFMEENEEDGKPLGNVTPKHAYIGSSNKLTPN